MQNKNMAYYNNSDNYTAFRYQKEESSLAREIKVLSEVEKIWILYDLDYNDQLDFEEVKLYLKEMAYPHLSLDEKQLETLFKSIDLNGDGAVVKSEMGDFVRKLMVVQRDLGFRKIEDVKDVIYGDGIKNKFETDLNAESKFKKAMTLRKKATMLAKQKMKTKK